MADSFFGSLTAIASHRAAGAIVSAVANPLERVLYQSSNMVAATNPLALGAQIVPAEDLFRLYNGGLITAQLMAAHLAAHGVPYDPAIPPDTGNRQCWAAYALATRPTLTADAWRTLFLWGVTDNRPMLAALAREGIGDATTQQAFAKLRFAPLTMGQVADAATARLWDDQVAARWGLDLERGLNYELWAARHGLNYDATGLRIGDVASGNLEAWQLQWRAHWRTFDLGTLGLAIRQFRPDTLDPVIRGNPNLAPLTDQEVDQVLAANGIAPKARYYYRELLYRPVGRRDATILVEYGGWTREQVVDSLQNDGYRRRHAEALADAIIMQNNIRQAAPQLGVKKEYWRKLIAATVAGYEAGSLSKQIAISYLFSNGVAIGTDPDPFALATIIMNQAEIALQTELVRKTVARAKADWMAGRTDLAGAAQRLAAAGVQPDRLQQTLQGWQLERGEGRIYAGTAQILRWVRKGFIPSEEASRRLTNLGWANGDVLLLLAEVQAEVDSDAAKLAAVERRQEQQQVKAMEALRRRVLAQQEKIVSNMRRLRPPAKVLRWVRDGLWTAAQAETWLGQLGYDAATVAAMMAEDARQQLGNPQTDTERAAKVAANLRRLTPPAKVVKWVKAGIRTYEWGVKRLTLLGYDPDSIQAMYAEAKIPTPAPVESPNGSAAPAAPPSGTTP